MTFFAEDFLEMMKDTVTIQALQSLASDSTPQYGSPRTYPARINYETHNVIGKDNQLVVARGIAWMACIDPIGVGDLATLSDGSILIILKSNMESDENGPAYSRLDFQ